MRDINNAYISVMAVLKLIAELNGEYTIVDGTIQLEDSMFIDVRDAIKVNDINFIEHRNVIQLTNSLASEDTRLKWRAVINGTADIKEVAKSHRIGTGVMDEISDYIGDDWK